MKRAFITRTARRQISEIWRYIANANKAAASRWLIDLDATFLKLGQQPGMGRLRPELAPKQVLSWSTKRYVVLYRRRLGGIEIMAVVHGSRDLSTLLQGLEL